MFDPLDLLLKEVILDMMADVGGTKVVTAASDS